MTITYTECPTCKAISERTERSGIERHEPLCKTVRELQAEVNAMGKHLDRITGALIAHGIIPECQP